MAPGPGACSRKWTRGWRRTQPTGPSRSSPSATHSTSTPTTSAPACDVGARTRTSPRSEGRPSAATRTGRGTKWWSTSRHRGASPERPNPRVAASNGSHLPERRRGSGGKEGSVVTSRRLPHGEVRGTRDAGSSTVSGHRLGPDRPTRTAPDDVHSVRELPRAHGPAVRPLDSLVEQRSIAPRLSRLLAGAHLLSGSLLLRLFGAAMAHRPGRQPLLLDGGLLSHLLQHRPALWAGCFGRPVRVRGPQTVPPPRCHRPGSRRPVGRAAHRANRHRPARCTRRGRAISPRVDARGHQRNLDTYTKMPATNLLRRRPPDRKVATLYPGTGVLVLAAVGACYGVRRRRLRRWSLYALVAALGCVLLSFGPLVRDSWLGTLLCTPS